MIAFSAMLKARLITACEAITVARVARTTIRIRDYSGATRSIVGGVRNRDEQGRPSKIIEQL